jgi:hypothetical protein
LFEALRQGTKRYSDCIAAGWNKSTLEMTARGFISDRLKVAGLRALAIFLRGGRFLAGARYCVRVERSTVLASARSDRPGQSKRSASHTLTATTISPSQLGQSHAQYTIPIAMPIGCGQRNKKSLAAGVRRSQITSAATSVIRVIMPSRKYAERAL